MKQQQRRATAAALVLMGLVTTGCGSMDRQTAGTVGGAVLGGVVGDSVIGGTAGTLGGAAAGAYIGNRATDPNRK